MSNRLRAFIKLMSAMLIFGSIGLFVRNILLPSGIIAFVRAFIGVLFLFAVMVSRRIVSSFETIKKNLRYLCFSGAAIGFNWILLFESYRYTSVTVSTLCYYMAPILVVLLSPLLLKETLTRRKVCCVLTAMLGMACISGIFGSGIPDVNEFKGVIFGFGAAALYASVILMNKQLKQITAFDKTIVQLAVAALVLLPYNLLTIDFSSVSLDLSSAVLLIVVGIVHTGLAYFLYFGSMEHLNGQSIAICSYIDPVIAVVASVAVLREPFGIEEGIGTILILGAAVVSELPGKRKDTK